MTIPTTKHAPEWMCDHVSGSVSPPACELRMLRRVSDGEITVVDGGYVHGGRPLTGELAQALVRLNTAGFLTAVAPGPSGHRPVRATAAGTARLGELGG